MNRIEQQRIVRQEKENKTLLAYVLKRDFELYRRMALCTFGLNKEVKNPRPSRFPPLWAGEGLGFNRPLKGDIDITA